MSQNPYAAPTATLSGTPASVVRIYTPNQVAGGAFLGGPIGLAYFLYANFITLQKMRQAHHTLLFGAVFVIVVAVISLLLPEGVPSLPFTIMYVLIAQQVAGRQQLTKEAILASPVHEPYSNWRVVGLGLLCFLASFVVMLACYFFMQAMGWID